MLRSVTAVTIALAFAWLLAGSAGAAGDTAETGTGDATVLQDGAKAPEAPRAGGRAGRAQSSTAWWNEAKLAEELGLTPEQRAKMDARLEAFQKAVPTESNRADFNAALQTGSWPTARSELDRLSELAAASVRTRGELKIGVLQLLTGEQRKLVVDRYPRLIHRPWGRIMRPGQGRAQE